MSVSSRATFKSTPFRPTHYPPPRAKQHPVLHHDSQTDGMAKLTITSNDVASTVHYRARNRDRSAEDLTVDVHQESTTRTLPSHLALTAQEEEDQAMSNSNAVQQAMRYIPPSQSEPPSKFGKPPAFLTATSSKTRDQVDPYARTAILNARPGAASEQDLDAWFANSHTEVFVSEGAIPPRRTAAASTHDSASTYSTSEAPTRWRQPRYQPALERCDEMAAKARMLPPVLGGRSKKDQLGSVTDSWGPSGEKFTGMFAIEEDPPSRSTSPFKDEGAGRIMQDAVDELREAKEAHLALARAGILHSSGQVIYDSARPESEMSDYNSWRDDQRRGGPGRKIRHLPDGTSDEIPERQASPRRSTANGSIQEESTLDNTLERRKRQLEFYKAQLRSAA